MNTMFGNIGLGLAVGAGLGAALGVAAGAVSVWLAAGLALGVLFMATAQKVSRAQASADLQPKKPSSWKSGASAPH